MIKQLNFIALIMLFLINNAYAADSSLEDLTSLFDGKVSLEQDKDFLYYAQLFLERYSNLYSPIDKKDKLIAKIYALILADKILDDSAVYNEDIYLVLKPQIQDLVSLRDIYEYESIFLQIIGYNIKPEESKYPEIIEKEKHCFFTYEKPAPGEQAWFDKYGAREYDRALTPLVIAAVKVRGKNKYHLGHVVTWDKYIMFPRLTGHLLQATTLVQYALKLKKWDVVHTLFNNLPHEKKPWVVNQILRDAIAASKGDKQQDRIELVTKMIAHGANYRNMRWGENNKNILHMSLAQPYFSELLNLPGVNKLFFCRASVWLHKLFDDDSAECILVTPWLYALLYEHNHAASLLKQRHRKQYCSELDIIKSFLCERAKLFPDGDARNSGIFEFID